MARGFNTTLGVATTDRIVTTLTTNAAQRSYSIWAYWRGAGGGGIPQMFMKPWTIGFQWKDSLNVVQFGYGFSTTPGDWTVPEPSHDAWHHFLVVYDSSSVSNNPVIYIDGVSQTVTETRTPVGTADTHTEAFYIGNQDNLAACFDGSLAEFAVWNALLTSGNATSLAAKTLPTAIGSPVCYFRIFGDDSPETDATGNGYTGTVTGTAKTAHPIGVTTQEGYRWRLDDGTETTATWAANQDTGIVAPANSVRRLRLLLDTSGDANAANYQLEYKEANAANWTAIS